MRSWYRLEEAEIAVREALMEQVASSTMASLATDSRSVAWLREYNVHVHHESRYRVRCPRRGHVDQPMTRRRLTELALQAVAAGRRDIVIGVDV